MMKLKNIIHINMEYNLANYKKQIIYKPFKDFIKKTLVCRTKKEKNLV